MAGVIQVGSAIGVWPTIALTVATTLAGSLLLRAQGLATLLRARAQMDKGELPAREMFEGVCLVLAGGLLTVPGFVTDTLGLLLFRSEAHTSELQSLMRTSYDVFCLKTKN